MKMLRKVCVALILLGLTGLISGKDDFIYWYKGTRKLMSFSENNSDDSEFRNGFDTLATEHVLRSNSDGSDGDENVLRTAVEEVKKREARLDYSAESKTAFMDDFTSHVRLCLFTRADRAGRCAKASEWFNGYQSDKDLVLMVHGVTSYNDAYIERFFKSISTAFLETDNYNVIGVNWKYYILAERNIFDVERNVGELIKVGHLLHGILEKAFGTRNGVQIPKIYYVGHDLGTVPAVVYSFYYTPVINSIYGLNPRADLGIHNALHLGQQHGGVVQTIITRPYPYALGHRNFYPIYNDGYKFDETDFSLAYQVLANSIRYGMINGRYCSNRNDYERGYCSKFAEIPIWYKQAALNCGKYPIGKYYFELPKPKDRFTCPVRG